MKKRITRCLALLLAVVMVLSVMPVAMAEETTQTQTYTKVTEAPADWSGTYLNVSEGDKLITSLTLKGTRSMLRSPTAKSPVIMRNMRLPLSR